MQRLYQWLADLGLGAQRFFGIGGGAGGGGTGVGAARLTYSPAGGLWTRRRVVWAGAVVGVLVLIAGAAWGIRERRLREWVASEVAAAKAVVLTDEQREAIVNEGRRVPMVPAGQEDRAAAARRVAADLGATYLQFADLPDVAGKPVNWYSHELFRLTTPSDHAKAKADGRALNADSGRQMLAIIRASGLPDAVAGVADRPLPARVSSVGTSAQESHTVAMAALMLMREAAIRGDLAEVRRQSAVVVAMIELGQDEPFLSHAGWAAQRSRSLCQHLDWIARTHPDREWLEAVLDIAASIPQSDHARIIRNEERFLRDELARMTMVDPERLQASIQEWLGDDSSNRIGLRRAPPAVVERVSFQEVVGAISGFAEDRIASLQVTPLVKRAEFLEQLRQERPEVYTNGAVWAFLRYWDLGVKRVVRSELRVRALRLSVRMELFRLEHGRLPTEAEFASMFANDPDAQDPYVGGLLRYRVVEGAERTVDGDALSLRGMPVLKRGYVLYAVGPDGSDNGGTRPLNDWSVEDQKGFDVVLP